MNAEFGDYLIPDELQTKKKQPHINEQHLKIDLQVKYRFVD